MTFRLSISCSVVFSSSSESGAAKGLGARAELGAVFVTLLAAVLPDRSVLEGRSAYGESFLEEDVDREGMIRNKGKQKEERRPGKNKVRCEGETIQEKLIDSEGARDLKGNDVDPSRKG